MVCTRLTHIKNTSRDCDESRNNNNNNNNNNNIIIIIIIIIIIYGTYIALYPDAQSALQNFVGDFARLLI